ncbi:hypothetical protein D0T24_04525 [Duganella sp. BJB480]|nr:hypothetical protein D0T26_11720 [Duganella sp. BJB489]RFP38846.1 hypothetical protein D0T24_04525 [Duganella sp. BJB480]
MIGTAPFDQQPIPGGFAFAAIAPGAHHAMALLQTTGWSIPMVAEACGYHAHARFRERYGCPPSHVR